MSPTANWPRGLAWAIFLIASTAYVACIAIWVVTNIAPVASAALPGFLADFVDPRAWWPIAAVVVLGGIALFAYARANRLRRMDWLSPTTAVLVATALPLGLTGFWSCSAEQSPGWSALFSTLRLFAGDVDDASFGSKAGCPPDFPLSLQAAGLFGKSAEALIILGAFSLIFGRQITRILARLAPSAVVVVGFDPRTVSMVKHAKAALLPRERIIVLAPELTDATRALARESGALAVTVDFSDIEQVRSLLLRRGRIRVSAIYLLDQSSSDNLARIEIIRLALAGAKRARSDSPLRLVVRIDDPDQAEDWRRRWMSSGTSLWLPDAISAHELAADAGVRRIEELGIRRVLLTGNSALSVALLKALARRAREIVAGLAPGVAVPEVRVFGAGSAELLESFELQQARYGNTAADFDLSALDEVAGTAQLEEAQVVDGTLVVLTVEGGHSAIPLGTALAGRHPHWRIWAWDGAADGLGEVPLMGELYLLGPTLTVGEGRPADVWEWFGRALHLKYLGDWKAGVPTPGHPSQGDWDRDLSAFSRQSNIRQVAHLLQWAPALGKTWTASGDSDSFLDPESALSSQETLALAASEHDSWTRHHTSHGWRRGTRDDRRRRHPLLVTWAALPDEERSKVRSGVGHTLRLLAMLGYRMRLSARDLGSPYERVGEVTATRLSTEWHWKSGSGDTMRAAAGDWRVTEGRASWSVASAMFEQTYAPVDGDRYRRIGTVMARRASLPESVLTLEGPVQAKAGDWIVTGAANEQWVVAPEAFRARYRPAD